MNNKFDNAYLNQYTDNVIRRGYEIYDEWIYQKHDSRKIVASAHDAVNLFKERKNMTAFVEVLAYIFAIDTHIKEKYNNILHCLFSYFSWRRETRALNTLKTELNIPLGEMDVRNLITVEIEKLAEKLETGWDEDGDDETHGGKRNGKGEEEAPAEEKEAEVAEENTVTEELADKEEKDTEEKEETPIEEAPQEEAKEEAKEEQSEKNETAESQQKEDEITVTDEKKDLAHKKDNNLKEENNVSDDASEPSTDKKNEVKTYNDAVDSPPLYKETVSERPEKKTSFIDEMIIDNMVKGDKTIIGYQHIDEAERNKVADIPQDTSSSQNEKNKISNKDAYLYDKMIEPDKGDAKQTLNVESTKQVEKVSEIKTAQSKESIDKNDTVKIEGQDEKSLNERIQVDLSASLENQVIKELGNTMSDESRLAFSQMQMDVAREKLSIAYEELGIDEPVEIVGMQEPAQINQTSVTHIRK